MRAASLALLAAAVALAPSAGSLSGGGLDARQAPLPPSGAGTLEASIPVATFQAHLDQRLDTASLDEGPGPAEGLRPGSMIEVGTGPSASRCTASWIVTDGSDYYIGTAGHCVLDEAVSSDGEAFDGVRVIACVASCESETGDLDGAGFVELGDVLWAQSAYLDNTAVAQGYDVAFVEIPVEHYDLVNTSIARWQGPPGVVERAEPEAGDLALQYGHGTGPGDAYPTEGRGGVFDGDGTTVTEECHHQGDGCVVHFLGAVTPGDSGSPVAVGVLGESTGEVEATAVAGIATHAAGYMTWGTIPFTGVGFPERAHTAMGTHIQQAIHLTERATGTELSVVTSNESLPILPPSTPDNLTVGNPGHGDRLHLDWDRPPATLALEGYDVYRSVGSSSFEAKSLVHHTNESGLQDTGLVDGDTYCYQVVAVDEAGQSSQPTPEACNTPEARGPPAPAVRVSNPGLGGQLTLAWSQPDHVRAIDHYVVERSTDGSAFQTIATQEDRVLADGGLNPDSTYAYRVHAVDERGLEGQANTTSPLHPTVDAPEWRQTGHDAKGQAFTGAAGQIDDPSVETTQLSAPVTSEPNVADLDSSGHPEVVTVLDADERGEQVTVQALEDTDSGLEPRWSTDLPATLVLGLEPSAGTAGTAVADLDDDPAQEVVAYVNYRVEEAGEAVTEDAAVYVLDGDTGEIEASQNGAIGFGTDTAPRVGNVLPDPGPEIVVVEEGPEIDVLGLDQGKLVVRADGTAGSGTSPATPVLADVAPNRVGLEVSLGSTVEDTGRLFVCEPVAGATNCRLHASTPTGVAGLAAATLSPVLTPSLVAHGTQAPGLVVRPTADAGTNATVDVGTLDNAPAVGPLGASGRNAIVSGLADPATTDLSNDGDLLLHGPTGSGFGALDRLERPGQPTASSDVSGQAVADVDGDGSLEVVAVDETGTVLAWRPTGAGGTTVWQVELAGPVESRPVLADVDGDASIEVVVGGADGSLSVIDDA